MRNRIRIYVAGEDRILRESLAANLATQADFEIVGNGAPADALQAITDNPVNIVILDADALGEVAQALVESSAAKELKCRFLVMTAGMPQLDAVWFLRHGVSGLFLKRNSVEDLLEAIRTIATEGKWLDQPFLRLVLSNLGGGGRPNSVPVLTHREHATLRWLVEGCTNKQIGEHLGISEAAVKATLQRLFEKMGVRTRGHLIRLAVEQQKVIG